MTTRLFIVIALMLLSATSQAEIALLCGDLAKIEVAEENAVVHVDVDNVEVTEVKFLYKFGKAQKVKSFAMKSPGTVEISTKRDTFVFHKLDECESEEPATYVSYRGTELPCACYTD